MFFCNKKEEFLFGMAVLGSLALGACSSDNDSIDITGNEADQLITLTVANNNTIRTRAGRPLVSAEANQSIENVLVYVSTPTTTRSLPPKSSRHGKANRKSMEPTTVNMRISCWRTSSRTAPTRSLPWATTTAAATGISRVP